MNGSFEATIDVDGFLVPITVHWTGTTETQGGEEPWLQGDLDCVEVEKCTTHAHDITSAERGTQACRLAMDDMDILAQAYRAYAESKG